MAQGTFHIITFGCQMNVNDSFWLARSLQRRGFVESPLEKAEVVILNTCSVRDKPEQKVYAALGRIKYETRRVPGSFAVVAGCVAQQIGAGFFERFPQVRLVVGGDGLAMAPDAIERLHGDPSLRLNLTDFSEISPERDPALPAQGEGEIPPVAFVNIMQGCDNFCTYCIVPFTRGRQKSRDAGAILDECRALIDNGAKEITLLGQNVNSYGLDKHASGDTSFARLLRKVSELPGLARLRFVTPHPKDLSPEVIAMFGEVPNLCPRLHLPLQAGSDRVLARMNRKYDMARYMTLVEGLRAARPDIALSTDLIVGFPAKRKSNFKKRWTPYVRSTSCRASPSVIPTAPEPPPAATPTRSNPPKSCVASNACRLYRRIFPPTGSRPAWAVKRIFCLKGQAANRTAKMPPLKAGKDATRGATPSTSPCLPESAKPASLCPSLL